MTWWASIERSSTDFWRTEHRVSVVCPATGTVASGPVMSARSPKSVIIDEVERAPFVAQDESLPIGRECRSVATLGLCSGVSLRVFIEREGEGS